MKKGLYFLLLIFSFKEALAANVTLGSSIASSSGSYDHAKYGLQFDLSFFEKSNYGYWSNNALYFSTFSAVNPGASSTPSAPDGGEKKSGQFTIFSKQGISTKWNFLAARQTSVAALFYFPSVSTPSVGSVTGALGPQLEWTIFAKNNFKLDTDLFFGASLHQTQVPIVVNPSLETNLKLTDSSVFKLSLNYLNVFVTTQNSEIKKLFASLVYSYSF